MFNYAVLNEKKEVVDVIGYSAELQPLPDSYVAIAAGVAVGLGYVYKNGKFTAPVVLPQPVIVVESIAADAAHNAHTIVADNLAEVRTIVGATLSITVRMEVGGQLYPANESFDMPITSVDGRVRPVRVPFENGRATFAVRMDDARIWQVSEAMINSALPADRHMRFTGLRVVAAEV